MTVAEIRLLTDDELDERRTESYWNNQWDMAMEMARKRKKRQAVDGVESLRRAADRRLRKNMKKLADALTEKAMAGDLGSMKMLVALAEAKKPDAPTRNAPSYALWLAAQPEYKEESEMDARAQERRNKRRALLPKEWWEEGYVAPKEEGSDGDEGDLRMPGPSEPSVNTAGNPLQP